MSVRELEDSVVELRRAAVDAIARVRSLERRMEVVPPDERARLAAELRAARRRESRLVGDMALLETTAYRADQRPPTSH